MLLGSSCYAGTGGREEYEDYAAAKSSSGDDIPVTVVSYPDYKDPLIHINRAVFAFNHVANRFLLVPLSKAYVKVVPAPVYDSIEHFFDNIKSPVYFFNHLFQLKAQAMGNDAARFGINSTLGVLGLFDPAEALFNIQKEETSFEDTLAHYGAGYGFYIVLPILGPSDLRGSLSLAVDHYLDPVSYLDAEWRPAYIQAYGRFHHTAPVAEDYEVLYKKSDEPYLFFRNLHLQGIQRDEDY